MTAHQKTGSSALAPEDEVLRRMLHTPPTHHKAKPAPAKKKPQAKRPTPRKAWE
jgi:hypothetical protein